MTSVQVDRLDGLSSSVAYKGPCKVATTANITLSGAQTIDSVSVVSDDRVLVKDQTDPRENGIYVASTGLWRRAKDFSNNRDIMQGTRVAVVSGSSANREYAVTTIDPVNIGTSNMTFERTLSSARYVATLADIKAIDTTKETEVNLLVGGNIRTFKWDGSDLSGTLITGSVTTTSISGNVLRKDSHGLHPMEVVYATTSANGLTAETEMFVIQQEAVALFYDAESGAFTEGLTVTGGTSSATGVISTVIDYGTTGILYITGLSGTFVNDEAITDSSTGAAVLDGVAQIIPDRTRFKLATSYANAVAGTAFTLTGTTNFTLKRKLDPYMSRYVIPTGKAVDGSQGAWVSKTDGVDVVADSFDRNGNDAEAIQAGINFVASLVGGNLRCLPREYTLNSTIYGRSNVSIHGDCLKHGYNENSFDPDTYGTTGTLLLRNQSTGPMFHIPGGDTSLPVGSGLGWGVFDLGLDGDDKNFPIINAPENERGSFNVRIHNVGFYRGRPAFYGANVWEWEVDGCSFVLCGDRATYSGVDPLGCSIFVLNGRRTYAGAASNSLMIHHNFIDTSVGAGIIFDSSGGGQCCKYNFITNNHFGPQGYANIYGTIAESVISGNTSEGVLAGEITINLFGTNGNGRNVISGNVLATPGTYHLSTGNAFDSITGNVMVGEGSSGYYMLLDSASQGCLVTGNVSNDQGAPYEATPMVSDTGTSNKVYLNGGSEGMSLKLKTASLFGIPLSIESTEASGTAGPVTDLYRNSASPAAADALAFYQWTGNTSTGAKVSYATLQTIIDSATNGAHGGFVRITGSVGGGNPTEIDIGAGVAVGSPTGGRQGNGTVNIAGDVYRNGVAQNPAAVTKNADFTLGLTENEVICNKGSSLTVTLPSASTYSGRKIRIKTITAFTVVSATSNVIPITGGSAGTAILAAAAGKWAELVSDGTAWVIMAAG